MYEIGDNLAVVLTMALFIAFMAVLGYYTDITQRVK